MSAPGPTGGWGPNDQQRRKPSGGPLWFRLWMVGLLFAWYDEARSVLGAVALLGGGLPERSGVLLAETSVQHRHGDARISRRPLVGATEPGRVRSWRRDRRARALATRPPSPRRSRNARTWPGSKRSPAASAAPQKRHTNPSPRRRRSRNRRHAPSSGNHASSSRQLRG